jgi:hypothetical protein
MHRHVPFGVPARSDAGKKNGSIPVSTTATSIPCMAIKQSANEATCSVIISTVVATYFGNQNNGCLIKKHESLWKKPMNDLLPNDSRTSVPASRNLFSFSYLINEEHGKNKLF